MSFFSMADNNVPISANRDGALYNVALSNQSFIIKGLGDELEPSVEGLQFTVGTGIAVLHGRHITSQLVTSDNTITLPTNTSGYVVLRLDLSRPLGTEAYLFATPTLTQEEINWNGIIYDLPIATFNSTLTSASIEDVRVIKEKVVDNKITEQTLFDISGVQFNMALNSNLDKVRFTNGVKFDLDSLDIPYGIDVTNLLATGTFLNNSYTATEDCVVVTVGLRTNNTYIDDVKVCHSTGSSASHYFLPLAKGQTLTYTYTTGSAYDVYGLKKRG